MKHVFINIAKNVFSAFVFEQKKLFYYSLKVYDPTLKNHVFSVENVDEKSEITCFRDLSQIKKLPLDEIHLLFSDLILYGKLIATIDGKHENGFFWRNAIMKSLDKTDKQRHFDKFYIGGRFKFETRFADHKIVPTMDHLENSIIWPYLKFSSSPVFIMSKIFKSPERMSSSVEKIDIEDFTASCQDKCTTLMKFSFHLNNEQTYFLCNVFKQITNLSLVQKFFQDFWAKYVLSIQFVPKTIAENKHLFLVMIVFGCLTFAAKKIKGYSIFKGVKSKSIVLTDSFDQFIKRFNKFNGNNGTQNEFVMLLNIIKTPKKQRKYNLDDKLYELRFINYDKLVKIVNDDLHLPYEKEIKTPNECLADFVNDDCETCLLSPKNPQDRCAAICKSSESQCKRNRLSNQEFCLQHLRKSLFFPIHKFQKQYNAYNDKPIDEETYGEKPEDSIGLLRYPQSQRPINSELDTVSKGYCAANEILMPVYRVHSLYHQSSDWNNDNKFCGKFWFYDKDSPLFLKLGKTRVFGSKLSAYASLYKELVDGLKKDQTTKLTLEDNKGHKKHTFVAKEKTLRKMSYDEEVSINYKPFKSQNEMANEIAATSTVFGAKLYPSLIEMAMEFSPFSEKITNNARKNAKLITNYFGNLLISQKKTFQQTFKAISSDDDEYKIIKHYPAENDFNLLFPSVSFKNFEPEIGQLDALDGSVCKLAALLGIDTIVLQHEVGSFDCVTEILDARENSVDHICSLNVMNSYKHNDDFPKIWFLENQVIISRKTFAGIVGVKRPVKINIQTGQMLIKSTETNEFKMPKPGFYN